MARDMIGVKGRNLQLKYLLALLTNTDYCVLDGVHPILTHFPHARKTSKTMDPDTPTWNIAMTGPNRKEYSPVVAWSTVRLKLCLATSQSLETRQVDFSNTFVLATLHEDVYIEFPKGFEGKDGGDRVLKLNKSLYGLAQAPLYWGNHLMAALKKHGFKASKQDPCLYHGNGMIILTYVDTTACSLGNRRVRSTQ
jgi:Reverse transcriptase (RNA-dependent DNA polymerase)